MIRDAHLGDIPALLALGEKMHAESPRFSRFPWSGDKVSELIKGLIASDDGLALVSERGGEIDGGFLGMAFDHWSVNARASTDFALFVRPESRGGLLGAQLLRRYVRWAKSRGVADELLDCGIATGVDVEASSKLYQICGFRPCGNLFSYEGN